MSSKILIISHTFPPSPGVGGRRWAKFAKYLSRNGHSVYVLSAENIQEHLSEWVDDLTGIQVEYLPYKYPKILSTPVKSTFDKINYRVALAKTRLLDKGNYYDKSIFWERQLHERIGFYIKQKSIDTVVVTGAPFRLVYYTTLLKKKFKQVTFISDFRDLWTEDVEVSAFSNLPNARKHTEKKYELNAIANSDHVFTVAEKMKNYFNGLTHKNHCVVIPNGYDPEDIHKIKGSPVLVQGEIKKVNFVFAGTLYHNLDYVLMPFFKGIKELKNHRPDLYKVLSIDFFGKFPEEYKGYLKENDMTSVVMVHGEKPIGIVLSKIQQAHCGVLFLNDIYNYSFSTKFCEYIGQKKKILVISNRGITSEFVVKNKLGFYIDPQNSYEGLSNTIEYIVRNNFKVEVNDHFDETVFSIPQIVKQIEKYFKKENK